MTRVLKDPLRAVEMIVMTRPAARLRRYSRAALVLLLLVLGLTTAAATGAATAPAARAAVIGVGDEDPSFLADPRFLALGVHEARLVVPWNTVIRPNPTWRRLTKAWLAAARAAGVEPVVSFTGNLPGERIVPVGDYLRGVRAFLARFPSVRRFTAWNEPDWNFRPLGRHPEVAAAYYDALKGICPGCTILAGDVYLPAPQLRPWLARYVRALRHRADGWALHDYYDVRDHSTAQLRALQSLTRGAIWLDETGGVETRGSWVKATSAEAAQKERYLLGLAALFPRISRIYHYQWRMTPGNSWDSGLVSPRGAPRPAYWAIYHATAPGRVTTPAPPPASGAGSGTGSGSGSGGIPGLGGLGL